jgi:uncharacterized protein YqfA (UPF0365 family)
MKSRLILFCFLVSALCLLSARAQSARPDIGGDTLKGAQAKALLDQVKAERNLLLDERRQALQRVAQAKTPEDKLKVMAELQETQRERRARLREDSAKVREAERLERAEKRPKPATPTKG